MHKLLVFTTVMALLLVLVAAPLARAAQGISWAQFKDRFMTDDGRIVDHYQDSISHSEGQGYGMLLAWAHDDRQTFDLLWKWSRDNLQVRKHDALFAWSWGQRTSDSWTALDLNNATDGDTLIAMSLLLGHEKWGDETYKNQALPIVDDIQKLLLLQKNSLLCLLPGYYGFINNDSFLLNPAYYIFSAYRVFARHHDKNLWMQAHADGLKLLKAAMQNPLQLPPDWIMWSGTGASTPPDKGAVFGYEAIRVPLYLSWDNAVQTVSGLGQYLDIISRMQRVPQTVDVQHQSISLQEAPAGHYAVLARAAADLGHSNLGEKLWKQADEKVVAEAKNYYSNVLYLLAKTEPGK